MEGFFDLANIFLTFQEKMLFSSLHVTVAIPHFFRNNFIVKTFLSKLVSEPRLQAFNLGHSLGGCLPQFLVMVKREIKAPKGDLDCNWAKSPLEMSSFILPT